MARRALDLPRAPDNLPHRRGANKRARGPSGFRHQERAISSKTGCMWELSAYPLQKLGAHSASTSRCDYRHRATAPTMTRAKARALGAGGSAGGHGRRVPVDDDAPRRTYSALRTCPFAATSRSVPNGQNGPKRRPRPFRTPDVLFHSRASSCQGRGAPPCSIFRRASSACAASGIQQ